MFPVRVWSRGFGWPLSLSAALGAQDEVCGLWFTFLGEALLLTHSSSTWRLLLGVPPPPPPRPSPPFATFNEGL